MKVSAVDKGTGKSESVTIESDRGRLSPEDIERMVADAEKFAEEDELVRFLLFLCIFTFLYDADYSF